MFRTAVAFKPFLCLTRNIGRKHSWWWNFHRPGSFVLAQDSQRQSTEESQLEVRHGICCEQRGVACGYWEVSVCLCSIYFQDWMIAPELWNFHCILLASFSNFSPEDVCRSFRKKLQSACRLSKSPSPRCEVARVVLTGGLHWQMPCFCRREILKVRSSCVQKRTVFFFWGGGGWNIAPEVTSFSSGMWHSQR